MKVVGLVSGGKDSCYNMVQCVAAGHELTCLAHLVPSDNSCHEADSYMYQTIGWDKVKTIANAMELPLYVETVTGSSLDTGADYLPKEGDEVEDLYRLLERVQKETEVTGVAVGAILSDYQRIRVENVCLRLGLTPLAYLWRRDQSELLKEMVDVGMDSIIVKVACLGLTEKHLGKSLAEMQPHLESLSKKYGVNVCGEGGEYETFTLDCPLFKHRIQVNSKEVMTHSAGDVVSVNLLRITDCQLIPKPETHGVSHLELLRKIEIDSVPLLDVISPNVKCSPFDTMENSVDVEEPAVEELDLKNLKQKFPSNDDSWFKVCCFGSSEDDATCVGESFEFLDKFLQENNCSLSDILKITLVVDSMENYAIINKKYASYFGINPPVRVCVAVDRKNFPENFRLMMSCVGQKRNLDKPRRGELHVQGLSHWAPANIGPYSQGQSQSGRVFLSGSIGLIPGSMVLVSDSEAAQAGVALRHVARVARVVTPRVPLSRVSSVTCYVTSNEAAAQAQKIWNKSDDFNPSFPIKFLQVSQLPRNAAVEWELELKETFEDNDDE